MLEGWSSQLGGVQNDLNLPDLFEVLSHKLNPQDQVPLLSLEEFIDAVIELVVFEVPLSTIETLALLRRLCLRMDNVEKSTESFQETIIEKMNQLQRSIDAIRLDCSI